MEKVVSNEIINTLKFRDRIRISLAIIINNFFQLGLGKLPAHKLS